MAKGDSTLNYVRRKIEKEREIAEFERKRKLKNRRIELARAGYHAYHNRKFAEATRSFQAYIRILEDINDVKPGGLKPSHFDPKKDLSELLMISGIYWDLVKLYDRTRSKAKYNDFKKYIEQFVIFSKDTPHQALCAEALRKYISGDKAIHKEDFKIAYRILSTYKCFIASALVDVVSEPTIPRLRDYRDQVLSRSFFGRQFIRGYYCFGPVLANGVDKLPYKLKRGIGVVLDLFAQHCTAYQRKILGRKSKSYRPKDFFFYSLPQKNFLGHYSLWRFW